MKNVIISLVVLVLVGMFLFVGCQNGESVKSPENDATGEIDSGFRVIDISKGFSDDEIKVKPQDKSKTNK